MYFYYLIYVCSYRYAESHPYSSPNVRPDQGCMGEKRKNWMVPLGKTYI